MMDEPFTFWLFCLFQDTFRAYSLPEWKGSLLGPASIGSVDQMGRLFLLFSTSHFFFWPCSSRRESPMDGAPSTAHLARAATKTSTLPITHSGQLTEVTCVFVGKAENERLL